MKAPWTLDMLFTGTCTRAKFSCIHTALYFKKITRFLASGCQGEIQKSPCLVPGLRVHPTLTLLTFLLMTLFGIQAVAMAHFAGVSLRFPCMELRCPLSRNGRLGRWEHLPPLSDTLTSATEAHRSEGLNRDNDSRPLSLLDSEDTSSIPFSVCISLFELRGRAWAFSVHRNHCGEKATAHRRELAFLGSSQVFWGAEVLAGSASGGTSSFRAARVLWVALGLLPGVSCPQVPLYAHVSLLRYLSMHRGAGLSSRACAGPVPTPGGLGGTFLLGAGRSRCCNCFSCWLLAQ